MADTLYEWMKKKGFGNIQEAVTYHPQTACLDRKSDMI